MISTKENSKIIHIRQVTPSDSEPVALLFMMVMESMVYRFLGEKNVQKGIDFFKQFIGESDNQYSYQNCYVAIDGDKIVGVLNIYDGSRLEELRQPILNYIHDYNDPDFNIEDETQPGEYYIDVIAVSPEYQGKGIGSQLLAHCIEEFQGHPTCTLGLLVDKNNPKAKQLYVRMGFAKVAEKLLSGHEMEHLQLEI